MFMGATDIKVIQLKVAKSKGVNRIYKKWAPMLYTILPKTILVIIFTIDQKYSTI